jgi:Uma2 family endonuclease
MELITTLANTEKIQTQYEKTHIEPEIDIAVQYQKERGKPMPSKNHSRIQRRLTVILDKLLSEQYDIYPEFEIELLGKKSVPDICLLPIELPDWEHDMVRGKDVPDLTIEILSPKQALSTLSKKIRDIYFPAGVKSSWIVMPDLKSITILYPNGTIQTYNQGILHDVAIGFEIPLSEIFR